MIGVKYELVEAFFTPAQEEAGLSNRNYRVGVNAPVIVHVSIA